MTKVYFKIGFTVPGSPYIGWTDAQKQYLKDQVRAAIEGKFSKPERDSWDNENITNPEMEQNVRDKIADILTGKNLQMASSTAPVSVKYVWYDDTRYCIHSYELSNSSNVPWIVNATGDGGSVAARLTAEISWASDLTMELAASGRLATTSSTGVAAARVRDGRPAEVLEDRKKRLRPIFDEILKVIDEGA